MLIHQVKATTFSSVAAGVFGLNRNFMNYVKIQYVSLYEETKSQKLNFHSRCSLNMQLFLKVLSC